MAKWIGVTEALEVAKKFGIESSRPTVIAAVKRNKLGSFILGRWRINPDKWQLYLEGVEWRSKENKKK